MNFRLTTAAAAILAASLVASYTYASDATPRAKKHTAARRAKTPPPPSVEDQIRALRQDLENQINGLKSNLADKDAQLKQAQQAAADAQAAADKANAAASASNQAVSDNAAAVSTLQTTVTDLKGNQASLATTVSDETAKIKASIESPSALHYKGVNITPGGFMAAETVWRAHATGADIPTPFTSMPFPTADAYHLSEFYGSGRQSRISLLAEGKVNWGTIRGYVEADFLSSGTNSNNNQSNSYVLRQRVVWAQAVTNSGWGFAGGQMWSLATEDKKGLSNFSSDIETPLTIDPNYNAGFVWTRQYGFRVTKAFGNSFALGIAAENPQVLAPGGTIALNTGVTYLWGTPGANGGNYNAGGTSTSCSFSTTTSSNTCTPSYLTTYAINATPDFIVKAAIDPGWGHYEIFGIGRSFRDRVYPGTSTVADPPFNDTEWGGGIGGSLRVPTFAKHLDVGVKGLWGAGVGRYGDSTIADVTVKPDGTFSPLHGFSALGTLELHATPRFDIYANYGADYTGRTSYISLQGKPDGYGVTGSESNSGCAVEPVPGGATGPGIPAGPSGCSGTNRDVQEATLGYWYDFYKGPKGRLRQSIQYSYADRVVWAVLPGYAPKAVENMVWTSFRYYIP
jgi:Skp family chaperone for outer membrane proteins